MCGHIPEPESRPGLSPVNPSSTPGALTSRGRPNKGPADVYPLPKPKEQPHSGLAEGPKQPRKLSQKPPSPRERPHPRSADGPTTTPVTPTGEPRERPHLRPAEGLEQPKKLHRRPLPPREQPHQVGLAEVLPRRVRNLLGPRTSAPYTSAPGGASLFRMWFLIRSWFLVAFLITIAFLIYDPDFKL